MPPEESDLDPDLYANMHVDRTQISLGLTGVSLKRTRMSGGSGQVQGEQPPVDENGQGSLSTSSVSQPTGSSAGQSPQSPAGKPLAAQADDAQRASATTKASSEAAAAQPSSDSAKTSNDEPDFEDVQLLSQFLVGLVSYGVKEVMERAHYYDDEINRDPQGFDLDKQIDQAEEKIETVFRYWLIGTLMWSERTALTLSYRTFQKSIDIGGLALRTVDRTTNNFLLRPIRKPFERFVPALEKDSRARIDEGRAVEQRGQVLATATLDDIVGDFIDYMAENPEVVDLITTRGMGLAGTVMDNGRQVGTMTDNMVENLVRKILRRPKRKDLPASPFEGKPQTMYDPASQHYTQDGKAKD
jgi:hypothetical protein